MLEEMGSQYGTCGTLFPSSGMRTWSIFPDQTMVGGAGCLIFAIVTVFRTLIHGYSGRENTDKYWVQFRGLE